MRCMNSDCGREIADTARFCPFCRANQSANIGNTLEFGVPVLICPVCAVENRASDATCRECGANLLLASEPKSSQPSAKPVQTERTPPSSSRSASSQGTILLRPSESIWSGYTQEGAIAPGSRRPLVILDEQVAHLAQTDTRLEAERLLQRVQDILLAQGVPVEVALVPTRWLHDRQETRSRIIASLRQHSYSDIKMILGVDYLGNWASVHMCLGMEPPPIPVSDAYKPPWDGIIAIIVGLALLIFLVGVVPLIYGVWRVRGAWKRYEETQASKRVNSQKRQQERMETRTFKVDDMRLFCAAMKSVFSAVVDDIVQSGGTVTRIQGGQGGYFETPEGLVQATSAPRASNAADMEI